MAGSNSKRQIARLGRDDWFSRAEAAEALGVGVLRIDWLVSNGHLEPAETETCLPDLDVRGYDVGVTRSSVQAEKRWRRNASRWRRWGRALRDLLETSGLLSGAASWATDPSLADAMEVDQPARPQHPCAYAVPAHRVTELFTACGMTVR